MRPRPRPPTAQATDASSHPPVCAGLVWSAAALWIVWLIATGTGLHAETTPRPVPSPASTNGSPQLLSEALRDLQTRGLQIFFSSNVVRPEMRVLVAPTGREPREILDQLLAPHGLTVEPGPGGRLVVVTAGPTGIRGWVRDRRTARPLQGAQLLIPGTALATASDVDGRFEFTEVEPGEYAVEARLPGFVIRRIEGIAVPPHGVNEVAIELEAMLLAIDEIVVTPSRVALLSAEPTAAVGLDRQEILTLPHLGDDVFRALSLLPGVSGEEISAQFSIRGGRSDEVLTLLDGAELFEPYHLKDFGSALSIIAPRTLGEVNLLAGGYPVQYGDRMSGVLEMTTALPERRRFLLGLGILSAEIGGSDAFADDRGRWLASLRRGNLDLAQDLLRKPERPQYWDGFGKLDFQLRPEHSLGLRGLYSKDRLDFLNHDPDVLEDYQTSYGNSYLWLNHQALLGPRWFVDSLVSFGQITRDRRGSEEQTDGGGFIIRDERALDVAGVKQDWALELGPRNFLSWGFEARDLRSHYDYQNTRELEDLFQDPRVEPRSGTTAFLADLNGEHYSLYLSDRWRPIDKLTLELGLRFDRQTLTDDRDFSPRFNLVYAAGKASTWRLAWGLFQQSQRPYELQVADGVTRLAPAERTEQRVVGFEHAFLLGADSSPLLLRLEAYQREVANPRLRFESLYDPVSQFPETEPDRSRIAPTSGHAYGIELFVKGKLGERIDWWASYAHARTLDRIDGRDVPRRIDQPHTFNLDFNFRLGASWNLNLAWRYHTGWPTTAISGRLVPIPEEPGEDGDEDGDEDGEDERGIVPGAAQTGGGFEIVPVLGPLDAERVSSYHRLDLRASREWRRRRGTLGFFVEIQNVYNRHNLAGIDPEVDFVARPDGQVDVIAKQEDWGGILPSFGITWEF